MITLSYLLKVILLITVIHLVFGLYQMVELIQIMKPEGDNLYYVTGLDGHKNFFSAFMFTTACLMSLAVIKLNRIWRIAAILVICIELPFILILQTRSVFLSMIAFTIVSATLVIIYFRKKLLPYFLRVSLLILIPLSALVIYGIYTETLLPLVERLTLNSYLKSATGLERLSVWFRSSQLLEEYWLLGVGAKNWGLMYSKYGLTGMFRMQYLQTAFLQPHNDFLWVWCELGIVGLISFLGIFLSALTYLIKSIKHTEQITERNSIIILTAWLIGFMIYSFFDFPKERMEQLSLLSLCLAIISVKSNASGIVTLPNRFRKSVTILTLGLVIAAVLLVGIRLRSEWLIRDMKDAEKLKDIKLYAELAKTSNTPLAPLDYINVPKYFHEGVAAYALGDYTKARECFEKAHQLTPYNFNVLNNLGGMETYFGNYDKALTMYSEALRINPKNDDTRFNVSYTLYQLQQYDSALAVLNPVWSNPVKKAEFDSVISAAIMSKKR